MRRIVAFLAWLIGAALSGIVLFGMIVVISRTDRMAWLAFALAIGTALLMKTWPRMAAFQRWLIAAFTSIVYLTYQVGPWLQISDRIGVTPTTKRWFDRFDRHFYTAQLLALTLIVLLLVIRGFLDRKKPWFSVWLLLALACSLLVIQYSGGSGAPGTFYLRLAAFLHISPEAAGFLVLAIRKCIHFTFYGLFVLFAVKAARSAGAKNPVDLWSGIGFALMHATFDEARQAYSPGRSSSFWDLGLDMAGMALFAYLIYRHSFRPTKTNPNISRQS